MNTAYWLSQAVTKYFAHYFENQMQDYIPVQLEVAPDVTHTVYLRRHQGEGSVVFIANLPKDATNENVKDICQALGDCVLKEFSYQNHNHGLIKLVDDTAAQRVLSKALHVSKRHDALEWRIYGPRGLAAYEARHFAQFPLESELQEEVDSYMQAFEAAEDDAAEATHDLVDEEGFKLVTGSVIKRRSDMDAAPKPQTPKRRKKLEKDDFYRFQFREQRKREMTNLLQKYQEDKQKVQELKKSRAFKPY